MPNTAPDTRTKILNAAQDLIQRRGLNAMSFQDLSDAVGIRKASVHHHFATKAEMVHALLERYQIEFQNAVCKVLDSKASGKTKLKRYCNLFLQTLEEGEHDKGCLCGMLVAELYSLEKEEAALVRKFFRSNIDSLQAIIDQGVADGTLSANSSPHIVLATLEGGLLTARCDGGPQKFAMMIGQLLKLLSV